MFKISLQPIVPPEILHTEAGGFVQFEGRVRDRNEGRSVVRLEYEAHEALAESEGQKILDEAMSMFQLARAEAVHRIGNLEIGETAIWIGVAAAHRDRAFKGCEYIIDEVKKRVPIWKKERYVDGESQWIGCHQVVASRQNQLFARQLALAEVGVEGQKKLARSRVLVVGAGGLGCAALPYLATSGVGTIGIADGDVVDVSNLHRQVLFGYADRGLLKSEVASKAVRRLNPWTIVESHGRIDTENVEEVLQNYDLVIDGTDNFATRFLLNDVCIKIGKVLVQAAIHRFDGQLMVIDPDSSGGCVRCIWGDSPFDGCVGTCAEEGILGPVAGVLGALQALEAIKVLLGMKDVLSTEMAVYDLKTGASVKVARRKRGDCPTCGSGAVSERFELDWSEAKDRRYVAIDVREEDEGDVLCSFGECRRIPWSRPAELLAFASEAQPVLLVCEHGARSGMATRWLRSQGVEAFSLTGGASLAKERAVESRSR